MCDKKPLRSLDEFNSIALDLHNQINGNSPEPNGIACPLCGTELLDTKPLEVLMSAPPQMEIHCSACKYKGYRFVATRISVNIKNMLSLEEWLDVHQADAIISFAESGADREMDFDLEKELENRYEEYVNTYYQES